MSTRKRLSERVDLKHFEGCRGWIEDPRWIGCLNVNNSHDKTSSCGFGTRAQVYTAVAVVTPAV